MHRTTMRAALAAVTLATAFSTAPAAHADELSDWANDLLIATKASFSSRVHGAANVYGNSLGSYSGGTSSSWMTAYGALYRLSGGSYVFVGDSFDSATGPSGSVNTSVSEGHRCTYYQQRGQHRASFWRDSRGNLVTLSSSATGYFCG
jgi:hypothetical protein